MLGFLKSEPFHDAALGTLVRTSGTWRGQIALAPHGSVEVRIAGGRAAPDAASLRAAIELPATYAALRADVARALFEHYEPGWESWKAGELADVMDAFPELKSTEDVWTNVRVGYVSVDASRAEFPVEVRLAATWDEEHTLGVRLKGSQLVELCGSVGPA